MYVPTMPERRRGTAKIGGETTLGEAAELTHAADILTAPHFRTPDPGCRELRDPGFVCEGVCADARVCAVKVLVRWHAM